MEKSRPPSSEPRDHEKDPGLSNIVKMLMLVVVLVGAWFLLDRLINGK